MTPAALTFNGCSSSRLTELFEHLNRFAFSVTDGDLQRHLAGQGVGGTAKAGVISAESHLNHIEHGFGDDCAFLDQALAAFLIDMLIGA